MKTNFNCKQLFKGKLLLLAGICLLTATGCEEDEVEEPSPEPTPTAQSAEVIPCDYFETNRVLVNDTLKDVDYVIDCFIYAFGTTQIIIEEGVTIEFTEDAGIFMDDNSRLIAEGTAEAPITFSGTEKTKGSWRGIFIDSYGDNSIQHAKIEYAGGTPFSSTSPVYQGSIAVASNSKLDLSHVEVMNGSSTGLDLTGHSAEVSTDNLTVSGNEGSAVRVCGYQAHIFNNTSTFVGNASDYINIVENYYEIETTANWKKLDVPYLVDNRIHVKDGGHLTLEAGVEVLFKEDAYLQAAGMFPYDYSLNISGTPADPVRLLAHGDNGWGGIYYSFTPESNIVKHAIIDGARGDISVGNITNSGAIYMHADPQLTIENTEFRNLPNCAYYAYTGASNNAPDLPNFTAQNITLTDVLGAEFCWGDGSE
ncbi:MAG TPA: hypothetical protein VJ911_06050 [Cryomorphaceae bacterium]|nr:hypothetical protein [Cryomorphaceae bacterium]